MIDQLSTEGSASRTTRKVKMSYARMLMLNLGGEWMRCQGEVAVANRVIVPVNWFSGWTKLIDFCGISLEIAGDEDSWSSVGKSSCSSYRTMKMRLSIFKQRGNGPDWSVSNKSWLEFVPKENVAQLELTSLERCSWTSFYEKSICEGCALRVLYSYRTIVSVEEDSVVTGEDFEGYKAFNRLCL